MRERFGLSWASCTLAFLPIICACCTYCGVVQPMHLKQETWANQTGQNIWKEKENSASEASHAPVSYFSGWAGWISCLIKWSFSEVRYGSVSLWRFVLSTQSNPSRFPATRFQSGFPLSQRDFEWPLYIPRPQMSGAFPVNPTTPSTWSPDTDWRFDEWRPQRHRWSRWQPTPSSRGQHDIASPLHPMQHHRSRLYTPRPLPNLQADVFLALKEWMGICRPLIISELNRDMKKMKQLDIQRIHSRSSAVPCFFVLGGFGLGWFRYSRLVLMLLFHSYSLYIPMVHWCLAVATASLQKSGRRLAWTSCTGATTYHSQLNCYIIVNSPFLGGPFKGSVVWRFWGVNTNLTTPLWGSSTTTC